MVSNWFSFESFKLKYETTTLLDGEEFITCSVVFDNCHLKLKIGNMEVGKFIPQITIYDSIAVEFEFKPQAIDNIWSCVYKETYWGKLNFSIADHEYDQLLGYRGIAYARAIKTTSKSKWKFYRSGKKENFHLKLIDTEFEILWPDFHIRVGDEYIRPTIKILPKL